MTAPSWLDALRSRGVVAVARALGADIGKDGIRPCPACKATRRHQDDRRAPVWLNPNGEGWACLVKDCGTKGDAVKLAAWLVFGEALGPGDERWGRLRERCAEKGLCDGPSVAQNGTQERERSPARTLPPLDEIEAVWAACGPAAADDEVSAWLRSRALDPELVGDYVRALPRSLGWPAWLPAWIRSRRAVLPAYDAAGQLRSLRFRAISGSPKVKATSAQGHTVSGLVLADVVARWLLEGNAAMLGEAWDGRVVVAEGEPDWLTWAQHNPDLTRAPAVFGVWAGSWTAEIAARIPDGASVVVRTDHDTTGDKYAAEIHTSLRGRCRVRRSRPLRDAA